MKTLLIVAHGSRRHESNEEIRILTEKVGNAAADRFDRVACAYLELAEPLIPDAIKALTADGAQSILVVPYFLARGTHVASDIPAEVDKGRAACPDVDIRISEYFGASPAVPELLVDLALSAHE